MPLIKQEVLDNSFMHSLNNSSCNPGNTLKYIKTANCFAEKEQKYTYARTRISSRCEVYQLRFFSESGMVFL